MIDAIRTAPAATPTTPTPPSPPSPARTQPGAPQLTGMVAQLNALIGGCTSKHGPVADAHRGARPASIPGGGIHSLLEQVNQLLPAAPNRVTSAQRPEVLMRPDQDQRDMLRGALKQLVKYERALGMSQPPLDPAMPLTEQFAKIDKRYNDVRVALDRAARGELELSPLIDATRVREVLDLAKERLEGVGFRSSFTDTGHIAKPGLIPS